MSLEVPLRLDSANFQAFNRRHEETDHTPDITFEPPTPNAVLGFDRGITPHSISLSSCQQTISESSSPFAALDDNIFSWQESNLNHDSPSISRPSSMSGTSVSGEESFFSANSPSPSLTTSPLQSKKSKSHARKKAPGHVNRPRNAFILFRSHAISNNIIPPSLGVKDNRAVSCIVATLWKSLPEDEKKQWKLEAEKEKELHRLQYPNYQFKPGNCGIKGKERMHAKTQESVREQCGVIADQILQAHGRASSNRKKDAAAKNIKTTRKSTKINDGLPKARKSSRSRPIPAMEGKHQEEGGNHDDNSKQYQPVMLSSNVRHRSLSSPPQISTVDSSSTLAPTDMSAIDSESFWQMNLQQSQARPRDSFVDLHSFKTRRKAINPAALNLTLQQSSFDLAFPSPKTVTNSAQTPRFSMFNVYDRPKSASPVSSPLHKLYTGTDAMLLSPLDSQFFDGGGKRSSNGWQSWSRLSLADVALPVMKARQSSTDALFSRRGTIFHEYYNTDVFSQSSQFHHTTISPTFQSYHHHHQQQQQRNTHLKGNSMEHEDLLRFADDLVEQRHSKGDIHDGDEEADQLTSEQDDDNNNNNNDKDDEMLDLSQQSPSSLISQFHLNHLALYDGV